MDDVPARAKRYTLMTKVANDEVICPTNGRYVLQMHTLEMHKKQKRYGSETIRMFIVINLSSQYTE